MFVKGETSERDGRDVSSPLRRRDGGEREGFRSLSKRASQPEREAAPQRVAALSRVPPPTRLRRSEVELTRRGEERGAAVSVHCTHRPSTVAIADHSPPKQSTRH